MKSVFTNEEVNFLLRVGKKYKLSNNVKTVQSNIIEGRLTPNRRLYDNKAMFAIVKYARKKIRKRMFYLSSFSTIESIEGIPYQEEDSLKGIIENVEYKDKQLYYTIRLFEDENALIKTLLKKQTSINVPVLATCRYNDFIHAEIVDVYDVNSVAEVVCDY